MSTSSGPGTQDPTQLIIEETDRRLDSYYEAVRPGEDDSPVTPMDRRDMWIMAIVAAALIILWLVGRFVILPIYT